MLAGDTSSRRLILYPDDLAVNQSLPSAFVGALSILGIVGVAVNGDILIASIVLGSLAVPLSGVDLLSGILIGSITGADLITQSNLSNGISVLIQLAAVLVANQIQLTITALQPSDVIISASLVGSSSMILIRGATLSHATIQGVAILDSSEGHGAQAQSHNQAQNQSNNFLHVLFPPKNYFVKDVFRFYGCQYTIISGGVKAFAGFVSKV